MCIYWLHMQHAQFRTQLDCKKQRCSRCMLPLAVASLSLAYSNIKQQRSPIGIPAGQVTICISLACRNCLQGTTSMHASKKQAGRCSWCKQALPTISAVKDIQWMASLVAKSDLHLDCMMQTVSSGVRPATDLKLAHFEYAAGGRIQASVQQYVELYV